MRIEIIRRCVKIHIFLNIIINVNIGPIDSPKPPYR